MHMFANMFLGWPGKYDLVPMIASIDLSQEIFTIDILTTMELFLELFASMLRLLQLLRL